MIDKFSDLKKDFNRKFVKPRYVDDLDLGIFWGWVIENFEPRNLRFEQQVRQTSDSASDEIAEEKHKLEYSMWSCKISWCEICKEHVYDDLIYEQIAPNIIETYHICKK